MAKDNQRSHIFHTLLVDSFTPSSRLLANHNALQLWVTYGRAEGVGERNDFILQRRFDIVQKPLQPLYSTTVRLNQFLQDLICQKRCNCFLYFFQERLLQSTACFFGVRCHLLVN